MSNNCVSKSCDCEKVEPLKENCDKLLELNDLKIRPAMRKISVAEWCNLNEAIRQAFYAVWCVIKNIVGFLCLIIRKLECLEGKVDHLCNVAKCQNDLIMSLVEKTKDNMLKNITFSMRSKGSSVEIGGATTYTDIQTASDGTFNLKWNMVWGGIERGVGTLTGKIVQINTLNDDSSINSHIAMVKFDGISYDGYGGTFPEQARFTIKSSDGRAHFSKTYDVGSDWSESIEDLNIGKDFVFLPKQSTVVELFNTADEWTDANTYGSVEATYTNENEVRPQPKPCEIKCCKC